MKNTRNPRGAGRKPLPYAVKTKWVPVELIPEIDRLIKEYKAKFK
tara:strand:+ start:3688 stop:3822 length:135 start_codon:yes stop_codon:yes gene_type:complete